MVKKIFITGVVTMLFIVNSSLLDAQANDTNSKCLPDNEAIKWFTPGSFKKAKASADKQNKLLLIKGMGFGLDELGAKSAKKGCW